jgi:plastocyanin
MTVKVTKISKNFVLSLLLLLVAACSDSTTAPATTSATTTTAAAVNIQTTTLAPGTTVATSFAITTAANPTPATTVVLPNSNSTPTPAPGAKGGATMKEAFVTVEQQVKNWESDAVYVSVFNNLEKQLGIEPDGRSTEWFFQTVSVKAGKRITWLAVVTDGKINVTRSSEEDLPEDRLKFQAEQALPPINNLIDTNELMAVARQNGGDKSDRPVGFRLAKSAKEGAALSFDLIFEQNNKTILIRVDALTGKLLENARG